MTSSPRLAMPGSDQRARASPRCTVGSERCTRSVPQPEPASAVPRRRTKPCSYEIIRRARDGGARSTISGRRTLVDTDRRRAYSLRRGAVVSSSSATGVCDPVNIPRSVRCNAVPALQCGLDSRHRPTSVDSAFGIDRDLRRSRYGYSYQMTALRGRQQSGSATPTTCSSPRCSATATRPTPT